VVGDESSMPTKDRVGLDEEDRPAVTTKDPRHGGEDRSIFGFETGTRDLALQDRELMAQYEDLGILGTVRATAQYQEVEYEADKTVETSHAPILTVSEPDRSHQRVTPVQYARTGIRHPQDRPVPTRRWHRRTSPPSVHHDVRTDTALSVRVGRQSH